MRHLIETALVISSLPMAGLALGLSVNACASLPSTGDQKAIVDTSCTLIAAFDGTPEEQAICATADDFLAIEQDIRGMRIDAGAAVTVAKARKLGASCHLVGTVCASDSELASAIRDRKAARK